MTAAIAKSLSDSVPVAMGGAVFGEHDVVADVTILKIGVDQSSNGKDRAWPVRIHAEGTYIADVDGSAGKFSSDAEFVVRRNDFDEWEAKFRNAVR